MIPTYNVVDFLEQTLRSVLDQKSSDMEICVVDGSTDKRAIVDCVKRIGGNLVSFLDIHSNVRVPDNFTHCVRAARGEVVHILHADDYVLPGFYSALRTPFENNSSLGMAFTRHAFINEFGIQLFATELHREAAGILPGFKNRLAVRNCIHTPSVVVRRDLYEQLGGFDARLCHAADWEMWMRVAANSETWFEPAVLACYRVHESAGTSKLTLTGENIRDCRKAIEIFQAYLDKGSASGVLAESRLSLALYALGSARKLFKRGELSGAVAQAREAFNCMQSEDDFWSLGKKIVEKVCTANNTPST